MKTNIDTSYINLFYIIYYSLHLEEKLSLEEIKDFDLKKIYRISKSHSLTALLYHAIKDLDIDIKAKEAITNAYNSNLRKTMFFENEYKAISDKLDELKIYHMPLKGYYIKELYPLKGTREFADFDVLYQYKDASKIKDIFVGRGYNVSSYKKGNHDIYTKDPFYNFEMHRTLFAPVEITKTFNQYYKDIHKKTYQVEGYTYTLKDEDNYIYFLAHAYKHFSRSGNGARFLVDNYLYLTKKVDMDFNYIEQECSKLKILDFYKEIKHLSHVLFDKPLLINNDELSIQEENDLSYILNCGTYGTLKNGIYASLNDIAGGEDNKVTFWSKLKYVLRRIFLTRSEVRLIHPWIGKTVIFIPFYWIVRVFKAIFHPKSFRHMKQEMKCLKEFGK